MIYALFVIVPILIICLVLWAVFSADPKHEDDSPDEDRRDRGVW